MVEPLLPEHVRNDPGLRPFLPVIHHRLRRVDEVGARLTREADDLWDFAQAHRHYGLHRTEGGWIFREWAPAATKIYLCGPFSDWKRDSRFRLRREDDQGNWSVELPLDALGHGDRYHLRLYSSGREAKRIPAYATRVIAVDERGEFDAEVWSPESSFVWKHAVPPRPSTPFLYEAHVGMATEEERVGTYREFADDIVPRIVEAGYNTIQLMAVAEHPYYGSFGYHVTSYFAPTSRFGTPDDLKYLVDTAHGHGLRVIFDVVHSHAARNEVEGLSCFDGTLYQYFHSGARGDHPAWDTRCFDYGKDEVIHFLLSNLRYWLEEYRCDGFRFDGVTSMLYLHHGLDRDFLEYDEYYGDQVDEDAVVYLHLANRLIHGQRDDAVTVAEDMSGMPGLATLGARGGYGFDFRLAMGIPDFWIDLIRNARDEDWPVGEIFHRVGNRREDEPTIAYSESHDQAIVGDQTIIFRLIGTDMYSSMSVLAESWRVERGLRLSKLIRLVTLTVGGEGYLNFMGNEFGHPDWIDFPRRENHWSHRHARRQWHLADDPLLKYRFVAEFDRSLLGFAREHQLLESPRATLLREHGDHQLLTFVRGEFVFVVNFHPERVASEPCEVPPGRYRAVLATEESRFGGHEGDLASADWLEPEPVERGDHVYWEIPLELAPRSAVVLKRRSCPPRAARDAAGGDDSSGGPTAKLG